MKHKSTFLLQSQNKRLKRASTYELWGTVPSWEIWATLMSNKTIWKKQSAYPLTVVSCRTHLSALRYFTKWGGVNKDGRHDIFFGDDALWKTPARHALTLNGGLSELVKRSFSHSSIILIRQPILERSYWKKHKDPQKHRLHTFFTFWSLHSPCTQTPLTLRRMNQTIRNAIIISYY